MHEVSHQMITSPDHTSLSHPLHRHACSQFHFPWKLGHCFSQERSTLLLPYRTVVKFEIANIFLGWLPSSVLSLMIQLERTGNNSPAPAYPQEHRSVPDPARCQVQCFRNSLPSWCSPAKWQLPLPTTLKVTLLVLHFYYSDRISYF